MPDYNLDPSGASGSHASYMTGNQGAKGALAKHQRGDLFRKFSREGKRGGDPLQLAGGHQQVVMPLSRIPQRQTNLSNVMESIREEDTHL